MLESLIGQLWPVIAAVLVGGFFYARQSGKRAVKDEITKADLKAVEKVREIEQKHDSTPTDALRERVRERLRRAGKR